MMNSLVIDCGTGVAQIIPADPIAAEVPESVDMAQARLALLMAGLLDAVNAAIAALPSPEREAAEIEWEFRSTVRRDSPLVQSLLPVLGMSDEQVDELFRQAAAL